MERSITEAQRLEGEDFTSKVYRFSRQYNVDLHHFHRLACDLRQDFEKLPDSTPVSDVADTVIEAAPEDPPSQLVFVYFCLSGAGDVLSIATCAASQREDAPFQAACSVEPAYLGEANDLLS